MQEIFAEFFSFFRRLFENHVMVFFSAAGASVGQLIFPDQQYLYAALAVLGIMVLDLLTKLYALSKTNGGLRKAIGAHRISSSKLYKGTFDKLLVFSVMLIICGMAYRVSPIAQVAVWFTQLIYTLMFLRDVLSIIENLSEAGVTGLGIFKRAVSKKLEEYMDETEENGGHDSHQTAHHEQNEQTRADAEGSAGTGDSLDRGGAEKSLGDPR